MSDRTLKTLAQHCPHLERLDLSHCFAVTSQGVEALADECKSLTSLNLGLVEQVTDKAVMKLAQNCRLQHLNLRACPRVTDLSLKALGEGIYAQCLKVIHLLDCQGVTRQSAEELQKACPQAIIVF